MTSPGRGERLYELSAVSTDVLIAGALANSAGVASFSLAPPNSGSDWLVAYLIASVSASGAASAALAAQCYVYTDAIAQQNVWDYTDEGIVANVGWYSPPRRLLGGQILVAQFTGCNQGDYAQLRCEYSYDKTTGV